jgi:hypothetical protein
MAAHSVARTSLPTLTVVVERASGIAEPAAPQTVGWEQVWQQRVEAAQAAAKRQDVLAPAVETRAAHSAEEQQDE